LNSVVPAGANYTITWGPTTDGTVTLVLLKGPSTNAVPQKAIVEKIQNSGSYVWDVPSDLEPSDSATPAQGYGIEIIVDATGQYQYSTQFGISNDNYKAGPSSSSSSSAAASSTAAAPAYADWSNTWSSSTSCSTSGMASATAPVYNSTVGPYATGTGVAPTGWFPTNSTTVKATGTGVTIPTSLVVATSSAPAASSTMTVPASSAPAASTTSASVQTGAAAAIGTSFAGLVVAAGVAVFAI
jgi:hypothetical protein